MGIKLQKKGTDGAELDKAESPFRVSSLYILPGFVDLNVLVAMARDVEDVFQRITDSDEIFEEKKKESNDKEVQNYNTVLYRRRPLVLLILRY